MRIVTRPDFDGIVCAVLLYQAENIDADILWIEPHEVQSGQAPVLPGDILANLPYSPDCTMWFDHHVSNTPAQGFEGAFEIAPSAARVVYNYYQKKGKLDHQYDDLIFHTDIIDAAKLDQDQVRHPENYPYIILSMTIRNRDYEDIPYWNRLVDLLTQTPIDRILEDPEVKSRCRGVVEENAAYETHLRQHTRIIDKVSITDFRSLDNVPHGNRFLTYSIFPETRTGVKIRFTDPDQKKVILSVGQSIFNTESKVNIGNLLARFGGGGHAGAGGCTLDVETADEKIEEILAILFENKEEG
jgi:hypothetical protein